MAACSSRASISSCDDDLHGVYRDEAGARWAILDNGATLEGYPLFDDFRRIAPDETAAPRTFDLRRGPPPGGTLLGPQAPTSGLPGDMRRRFTKGGDHCNQRAPLHVTVCQGDRLELVTGDPIAPATWKPCTTLGAPVSHVERWTRD